MNIFATRRFGLRGILLSSALVMFSGAATAAFIPICTPAGQTCEVLSLTPVVAVRVGTSANWDMMFASDNFLQLPDSAASLSLSLRFDGNHPIDGPFGGDIFFDGATFGIAVTAFYLTDVKGAAITAGLNPVVILVPGMGVGSNGFTGTWTGDGLDGLAIYDFHVSCVNCAADALDFEVVLTAYSFALTTDAGSESDTFTIGTSAVPAPAPASLALLGLGLIAVGGWSRRRNAA